MSEWWLLAYLVLFSLLAIVLLVYPLRKRLGLCIGLVLIIIISAGLGYGLWGGFVPWQKYMQQQKSKKLAQKMLQSIKSPQQLIDKLKVKLDDSPTSAKGWYLLGRLYMSDNQLAQAVTAFSKACRFEPDNEKYIVNYAQSLWENNNRQFNAEIRQILSHLLDKNPGQADALAMLAMDAYEQKNYHQAIAYWRRLLKILPADDKDAETIRRAIAKIQQS